MEPENPYQPPATEVEEYRYPYKTAPKAKVRTPAISPANTILPRVIAANFDWILALICMLIALKANPVDYRPLHFAIMVVVVPCYYCVSEALFSRTPGKLLMGLVIRKFDGGKIGWREAMIRTAFRLIEVNPFLFGALPAGAAILFSTTRQRLGDRVADTVVVLARRVPKMEARSSDETQVSSGIDSTDSP